CYWFIDNYHHFGTKNQYEPQEYEVELIEGEELETRMEEVSKKVENWKITHNLPERIPPTQKLKVDNIKRPAKCTLIQSMNWKCKACPFFTECKPTGSNQE